MKIAVAGGKGGTGKTLIATALSIALSGSGDSVVYCDADVEGPNGRLFLDPQIEKVMPYSVVVPMLDAPHCSGCGSCQSICAFNGILSIGKQVVVFPELCHSCGACFIACEDGMLARSRRHIGNISIGSSGSLVFFEGALNVGEARVSPLITGVTSAVAGVHADFTIIDNPPGTSCAAVAGQQIADLLVLVTEPTPFGLHDLKLALALGRHLNKPMIAVLNRADACDSHDIVSYLERRDVSVVAKIPFNREIAAFIAEGQSPLGRVPLFDAQIILLIEAVRNMKDML